MDGSHSSNCAINDIDELDGINLSEFCDETVLQLVDNPYDGNVSSATNLRTDYKFKGFDASMGKTWIYPTNYDIRQYQMNICRNALFKNTLVSKPK